MSAQCVIMPLERGCLNAQHHRQQTKNFEKGEKADTTGIVRKNGFKPRNNF